MVEAAVAATVVTVAMITLVSRPGNSRAKSPTLPPPPNQRCLPIKLSVQRQNTSSSHSGVKCGMSLHPMLGNIHNENGVLW